MTQAGAKGGGGVTPPADLSDNLERLVTIAKSSGYLTYDQLNEALPQDQMSSAQIEDLMSMLGEMGVEIVESEEAFQATRDELISHAGQQEDQAIPDIILGGKCIRIAKLPYTNKLYRQSRGPAGLTSRLLNRLAREKSVTSYVGFAPNHPIKHLNHDIADIIPAADSPTVEHNHLNHDGCLIVITEASHWWAELKVGGEDDLKTITFEKQDHILPYAGSVTYYVPSHGITPLEFRCPPLPQHPEKWEDRTYAIWPGELGYEDLGSAADELQLILPDPLSPTSALRRKVDSFFWELGAHGIYAVDEIATPSEANALTDLLLSYRGFIVISGSGQKRPPA